MNAFRIASIILLAGYVLIGAALADTTINVPITLTDDELADVDAIVARYERDGFQPTPDAVTIYWSRETLLKWLADQHIAEAIAAQRRMDYDKVRTKPKVLQAVKTEITKMMMAEPVVVEKP